jgi:hypothetical protein
LPSFRLRCRRALTSQSAVLRFSRAAILAGPLPVWIMDPWMRGAEERGARQATGIMQAALRAATSSSVCPRQGEEPRHTLGMSTQLEGRAEDLEALRSTLRPDGARALCVGPAGIGKRRLAEKLAEMEHRARPMQWWLSGSTEASVLLGLGEFGYEICGCLESGGGTALAAAKAMLAEQTSWLIVIEDVPLDAMAIEAVLSHFPSGRGAILMLAAGVLPPDEELRDVGVTAVHALGALSTDVATVLLCRAANITSNIYGVVDPEQLEAPLRTLGHHPLGLCMLGRLLALDESSGGTAAATSVQMRAPAVVAAAAEFAPTPPAAAGPEAEAASAQRGSSDNRSGWFALQFGLSALRRALAVGGRREVLRAHALLYALALLGMHGLHGVDQELFAPQPLLRPGRGAPRPRPRPAPPRSSPPVCSRVPVHGPPAGLSVLRAWGACRVGDIYASQLAWRGMFLL